MASPGIRPEIEEPNLPGAGGLLASLVTDADGVRRIAGPGPVLTDDHCSIEYTAPRGLYMPSPLEATLKALDSVRGDPVEEKLYEGFDADALRGVARSREARRAFAAATGAIARDTSPETLQAMEAVRSKYLQDRAAIKLAEALADRLYAEAGAARLAGSLPIALQIFHAVPRNTPRYAEAQEQLAGLYNQLGRHAESERALEEVVRAAPRSVAACSIRAAKHEAAGRFADAATEWRVAVEDKPTPKGYLRLIGYLLQAGRKAEALEECRKLLALDPANADAKRILSELGR